jgi:dTDP-glucose 4,6-dehydratase
MQSSMETKIARCFAFVGPYLPLDIHYAIGNFIRDAMKGSPIVIKGDGTPYRSYLYAADLAIWLWTIFLQAESCRPYNVGSENAISIHELAELVRVVVNPDIQIKQMQAMKSGEKAQRYVPSVKRAEKELLLNCCVPLEESIKFTQNWENKFYYNFHQ